MVLYVAVREAVGVIYADRCWLLLATFSKDTKDRGEFRVELASQPHSSL